VGKLTAALLAILSLVLAGGARVMWP